MLHKNESASLSHVQFFVTPWTIQFMEFSRPKYNSPGQNTGVGSLPLSPGDLPKPVIELRSPTLQASSLPVKPQGKSKNAGVGSLFFLQQIFPTQELNWAFLHCRQVIYQLSYQGGQYTQMLVYNLMSFDKRIFPWTTIPLTM